MPEKTVFPRMPKKVWQTLRAQFIKSVPSSVTYTYLMSLLLTSEKNARNLLPSLKQLKLIDDEGKPTDRARDWRSDAKYDEVRQAMIDENYPAELQELFPWPDFDKDALRDWFLHSAQLGESAADQAASTYVLLNTPLSQLNQRPIASSAFCKRVRSILRSIVNVAGQRAGDMWTALRPAHMPPAPTTTTTTSG